MQVLLESRRDVTQGHHLLKQPRPRCGLGGVLPFLLPGNARGQAPPQAGLRPVARSRAQLFVPLCRGRSGAWRGARLPLRRGPALRANAKGSLGCLLLQDEQRVSARAGGQPLPGRRRQLPAEQGAVVLAPVPPGLVPGAAAQQGQVALAGRVGFVLRGETTRLEEMERNCGVTSATFFSHSEIILLQGWELEVPARGDAAATVGSEHGPQPRAPKTGTA